jgi:hypothetical protein
VRILCYAFIHLDALLSLPIAFVQDRGVRACSRKGHHMAPLKSLDKFENELIATLLHDFHKSHGVVFNITALRKTLKKVDRRVAQEGLGFLTKTLPRLGKAFDLALSSSTPLNISELRLSPYRGSLEPIMTEHSDLEWWNNRHDPQTGFVGEVNDECQFELEFHGCPYFDRNLEHRDHLRTYHPKVSHGGLTVNFPSLLGEFFNEVLRPDGTVRPEPCATSVRVIRQFCYLFYKYELPYTHEQEQQVLQAFEKTEQDLASHTQFLHHIGEELDSCAPTRRNRYKATSTLAVAREARILLARLFAYFEPLNIVPRHGPGAVATKQKLEEKYRFVNVSDRITSVYPLDAFFCASLGHVCDTYKAYKCITGHDLPARVLLVPKDSRGPRLISCEPVDFQWVQQGLGRAIVEHVEGHRISKYSVHFTDQMPNRIGALLGSQDGRYATLDLKEASDRVSLALVRLLFPSGLLPYLEASRSLCTELPDGRILHLDKFAPMGSALCFPILALTIWSILQAGAPDGFTRERILVYGDDVIVPTAYAAKAIEHLESFGLLVNRDKSCTSGLFRESCGLDAFKGVPVTPVRFRTVWSSTPGPDVYTSWIAYANSCYDRQYYGTYETIVSRLKSIYGPIPSEDMHLACPSIRVAPEDEKPQRRRWNKNLQKFEYFVTTVRSRSIARQMPGWHKLLRFFTERGDVGPMYSLSHERLDRMMRDSGHLLAEPAFSVDQYTERKTSSLVKRWR